MPDVDQVAAPSLVLVVEDEAIIRMGLVAELRSHGFHVLEAADASSAMVLFRDHPGLEAVVVDIGLAGEETGYDVVQAMRRERPGCRVVIASAHDLRMPDDFDEYVMVESKPYDAAKIAVMLHGRVLSR